jgi:hypothetical protein
MAEDRELDDGQYVVHLPGDAEPKIARYAGEVWLFHGVEEGLSADELHGLGARVGERFDVGQETVALTVPLSLVSGPPVSGQYIVQVAVGEELEVALYADGVYLLHGFPDGLLPEDMWGIGAQVVIDRETLRAL